MRIISNVQYVNIYDCPAYRALFQHYEGLAQKMSRFDAQYSMMTRFLTPEATCLVQLTAPSKKYFHRSSANCVVDWSN
jgi:hypothetical protein